MIELLQEVWMQWLLVIILIVLAATAFIDSRLTEKRYDRRLDQLIVREELVSELVSALESRVHKALDVERALRVEAEKRVRQLEELTTQQDIIIHELRTAALPQRLRPPTIPTTNVVDL